MVEKIKPYLLYVLTEDWSLFTHRIDLARRAQNEGYRVGVACSVQEHEVRIRQEGFDLYSLKHLKRGSLNPLQDMCAFLELCILYRKINPTLIHHVALKPVLYGTLAARFTKIPAVVNALGGLGYLFISPSFKARCIRFYLLKFLKFVFRHKKLILILQNTEDISVFRKIIPSSRCVLVRGSGVNLKTFAPLSQKRAKTDILKVLMCARLLWDKGVGEVMTAARILKKENIPLRIQIAGALDSANPSSIPEKLLEDWKKEDVVDFLGAREDISCLLRASDIAILPSYREGLPKALLEAASAGLPIIATNVPGCREIVREGVNGFLIPPRDPLALVAALKIMLHDPKRRESMGRESRQLVEAFFSEEKINGEILNVYRSLLKPA